MREQLTTTGTADRARGAEGGYVAPEVTVLGSLDELTTQKAFNASDGASFFGVPEGITGIS